MGRPPLCRTAMTKTQIQRPWRRNVKRKARAAKQELRRQVAKQRKRPREAAAESSNT